MEAFIEGNVLPAGVDRLRDIVCCVGNQNKTNSGV